MSGENVRKRRRADDGHQLQTRAKRHRDKPTVTSGNSNELESHLRGGAGSDGGFGVAERSHADGSEDKNEATYYLYASDGIVCGIAEALHLPEDVLQNFSAATISDKRYGNHAKATLENARATLENLEERLPEPIEQTVRDIIQHPTDDVSNASFTTTWNLLQAQRARYATQFQDILPGTPLSEELARALQPALLNLQAMEVFGHLRCWDGFSSDLVTRLDGDRQLRSVRMEWNRLQLLMDSYVLNHGSRPLAERNAKHGEIAQRARKQWIQEDSQWTFSDPVNSVHIAAGNGFGPPANVRFQQPPKRPNTTLDDPRAISPSPTPVRRIATTSRNAEPRPPPTRRPLSTMGSQQLTSASTARLEALLLDLVQKVDNMEQQTQDGFARLNREIGDAPRHLSQQGIQQGQRDNRQPFTPLRRLSLSQLAEQGPSIPGQRPIPGPVRIFNAHGWREEPQQSPDYGPPSSLSPSSQISPPQGASTPKKYGPVVEDESEEYSELEDEPQGETSVAGPSGTQ